MEKIEILMPGPEDAPKPSTPRAPVEVKRKPFPVDGRDRLVWLLGWLWCALMWDVLSFPMDAVRYDIPLGLGVTVLVAAFYALVWGYLGAPQTASGRWLLLGNLLLSLTFALTSRSEWFRMWNGFFLILLTPIQLYEWIEGEEGKHPWFDPRMVAQRWAGGFQALFLDTGINLDLARSLKHRKHRKILWALAGLLMAVCLTVVVVPLLASADALFDQILARWTTQWLTWLLRTAGRWLCWLVLGAVAIPFLMSWLYSLRHPETAPLPKIAGKSLTAEPVLWITVLTVLDGLYLLFLAVQSMALFGGPEYLARAGISYADYARSGFFQLVGVVFLNLSVLLLAVQLSRREGKGWRAVQCGGTVLILESFVLLVSAAWRMTLYVTTFGLTFKRVLTYWGMLVAAVFLVSALCKVWRPKLRFFRVLFGGSFALWLALNAINPAYLSAWYNVSIYERCWQKNIETRVTVDAAYLTDLSYDVLGQLEHLEEPLTVDGVPLSEFIALERVRAAEDCRDWRSWNLSSYLAARP